MTEYNYDGQTMISYQGTDNLSIFPDRQNPAVQ